ncbi:MAG: XRE family transcriptional regulator [Mycobacterium sp.]|nr:MAG: XRE family transcriptional regulator [Mycobacterium sp.]
MCADSATVLLGYPNPRKSAVSCVVMAQWDEDMHRRIADAIKSCRDRGDLSAQQLADRTAELGYPLSRSQIANYESGRKKNLDVAELIVLAAALNTSPVCLVYPGPYQDAVELLPNQERGKYHAAQWFSGEDYPLPDGDGYSSWEVQTGELRSWRRLQQLRAARARAEYDFLFRGDHDGARDIGMSFESAILSLERELGISGDA